MSYTETTRTSWLSRMKNSFGGIVFGILLFLASFALLWYNEGRAVQTAKSLEEGEEVVVKASNESVLEANDGKLIHVSGKAETPDTLIDGEFSIAVAAIKLVRKVEMYQWIEKSSTKKEKKFGGAEETVTTYDYEQAWSSSLIGSANFKVPEGHQNPSMMPYESSSLTAASVTMGAYALTPSIVSKISKSETLTPSIELLDSTMNAQTTGEYIYIGNDPGMPNIGDVRVKFSVVKPQNVSVIARQVSNTLEPYHAEAGDAIEMVKHGIVSPENMFKGAHQANTVLTWILRVLGFFMMFGGLKLVLAPIGTLGDVILIGGLLRFGTGLAAGLVAFVLTFVTIALAWLWYRPLIGIGLLIVASAGAYLLYRLNRKKKADAEKLDPQPDAEPPSEPVSNVTSDRPDSPKAETIAGESRDMAEKLRELKQLQDEGILTQEEFEREKKKILDSR